MRYSVPAKTFLVGEYVALDGGPSTAATWWAEDGAHAIEPVGPVRQAIVVELGN